MIGVTRAKNIVMRSRRIPGRQAQEWGSATECVADPELEAATDRLVEELLGFPPLVQRTAKKLLNDIEEANLSLAIELEGQAYGRLRCSTIAGPCPRLCRHSSSGAQAVGTASDASSDWHGLDHTWTGVCGNDACQLKACL